MNVVKILCKWLIRLVLFVVVLVVYLLSIYYICN
nr:MAG TPA: hypothetical protein [Caudoviricetes sp.]